MHAWKNFQVCPTACIRKLIVILNAMLRTNQFWHTPALAGSASSRFSPLLDALTEHGLLGGVAQTILLLRHAIWVFDWQSGF